MHSSLGNTELDGLQEKVKEAVELTSHWMDRFDVIVVGPGLGRDELVHASVKEVPELDFLLLLDMLMPIEAEAQEFAMRTASGRVSS